MLGRSHSLCGLIAGVGEAEVLDHAPLLVRLLAIPVVGGAALLPDIDKPGSYAARFLGPVTTWIAHGVAALSVMVYDATRTNLDPTHCNGGHRQLTHTPVWGVMVGVMTGVAMRVHPLVGVMTLTLLCGLVTPGFMTLGIGFMTLTGVGSWIVMTHDVTWWWVWPVSVTVGSWVHLAGDAMTPSGVPLFWPVTRRGERWCRVHTPGTFTTGDHFETGVMTPLLIGVLAVSAGLASGVIQAVYHVVAR